MSRSGRNTREYSRRNEIANDWFAGDYNQQYEGARSTVTSYPRGGQRIRNYPKGGSRDNYNKRKTESKRGRENVKTQSMVSQSLDKKIGAGMDDLTEALNKMEANRTLIAITSIITTRGIAFTAAQIYFQVSMRRNATVTSIYRYYRVHLAMIEARVLETRQSASAPYQPKIAVDKRRIDPAFMKVVHTVKAIPDLTRRILEACGPTESASKYYVPAFAAARRDENRVLKVLPGEVRYSNLREVVECLSDRRYSIELRRNFYARNPIPGAIWELGNNNDPVLMNPNEIIPIGFTLDDLQVDVNHLNTMMTWMQGKMEKFVSVGVFNYTRKGEVSMLMSNGEDNLRFPDRNHGEALVEYYNRLNLEGNIQDYWACEHMTKSEELIGQLGLLGEVPSIVNYIYPDYILHDSALGGFSFNSTYTGIQELLYG